MIIPCFPFQLIDWTIIEKEIHNGETSFAAWQVLKVGDIRIRKMEYEQGYKADHWCSKGHIIFCLKGEMTTELEDGRLMTLTEGMTYIVGDNNEAHKTFTKAGCTLFVVD